MKKVLIITYYWPPSGGAGVQRCLYFAKYLRKFGWEPVIYTIKDGEYPVVDPGLKELIPADITVLKSNGWEPYTLYKRILGIGKKERLETNVIDEKGGILHSLMIWIRGNFFIPDARKFWIKPSVRFLNTYLKGHRVDAILSSSPPQSVHLIAKSIHKKFNIPWIADFRDPWTKISFYDKLQLSKWADEKHKALEQSVLKTANTITTVTWKWQRDFEKLSERKVELITNGFDDEVKLPDICPDKNYFTFTYIGSLTEGRNPEMLWKAMQKLTEAEDDFSSILRLKLVGKISPHILESIHTFGLEPNLSSLDYIPHDEVFDHYMASDVLLLIGIPGISGVLPGKVFEMLYSGKPIFSIGPTNSDTASLISKTGAGVNFDFADFDGIYTGLDNYWRDFKSNKSGRQGKNERVNISQYSREKLTERLATLLDRLTEVQSD